MDRYLQNGILTIRLLHLNRHAYRVGHSTETALHSAVYRIEEQLEKGRIMVEAFSDSRTWKGRSTAPPRRPFQRIKQGSKWCPNHY